MTHRCKSGHVGSMLSMAEILCVLYKRVCGTPSKPASGKTPKIDPADTGSDVIEANTVGKASTTSIHS